MRSLSDKALQRVAGFQGLSKKAQDSQGLSNRETEIVFETLNSDEEVPYWAPQVSAMFGRYNGDLEKTISELADEFRWYYEGPLEDVASMYRVLLDESIAKVDWYQVATKMMEYFMD